MRNHIHNKIPSYRGLRRHGPLVRGDMRALVIELAKVFDGILSCGKCGPQAHLKRMCEHRHVPVARMVRRKLPLVSARHSEHVHTHQQPVVVHGRRRRPRLFLGDRCPSNMTNSHVLKRVVKLGLSLVAAPDRRNENPRILAERMSVLDDLVGKRPYQRKDGTRMSPRKTPKSFIYARTSVLLGRSQAREYCEESADIAKIMDVLGRGLHRASPVTLF